MSLRTWFLPLAFICAFNGSAAAQPSFDLPPGFKEQPATEDEVVYAGESDETITIEVTAYQNGDVRLTRIVWSLALAEGPMYPALTRATIEAFEADLAEQVRVADGVTEVPDTRTFDDAGRQMIVEAFAQTKTERIYHRRIYGLDQAGVVHLFWLICRGPARQIAGCEKAQRTMKLVIPDEAAFPIASAPPPPPQKLPWSVEPPSGYTESSAMGNDPIAPLRKYDNLITADARLYDSPKRDVQLIALGYMTQEVVPFTWAHLEMGDDNLIGTAVKNSPQVKILSSRRKHVRDMLMAETTGEVEGLRFVVRRMYGANARNQVYGFMVTCGGAVAHLDECVKAMQTMRLEIPDQVTPKGDENKEHRSLGYWIGAIALFIGVVGLTLWLKLRRSPA
jgi:hypothetical protein